MTSLTSLGVRGSSHGETARARMEQWLSCSPLFSAASERSRGALVSAAGILTLPPATKLIEQGSSADALYLVGRGRVRVLRSKGPDRVMVIGYRSEGELVGEACLGGAPEHTEEAVAMSEVEAAGFPRDVLDEQIRLDPALGSAVLAYVTARRRKAEERVASLLFRNVESRLCEMLVEAAERWGVPSARGTLIDASLTHLEIAEAIGSTRETVTLSLGALRKRGLLDIAGRRLIVRDQGALVKIAEA